MDSSPSQLAALQQRLSALAAQLSASDSDDPWLEVETASRTIANALRVRDNPEDNHTSLGQSDLPKSITTLLQLALRDSSVPKDSRTSPVFEMLRVTANLCMDHDQNRSLLLDAGVPSLMICILEGYANQITSLPVAQPLPMSISHLKVVRTAIGTLLNASIGFDPVRLRLLSLDAAITLLKLSTSLYPPGFWSKSSQEESEESWLLRCGISSWTWRVISELRDIKDDAPTVLNPDALPLLIPPLAYFTPPYPDVATTVPPDSELSLTLIQADFEALDESCSLLESLSLDVEDVRLSLARGFCFPAEHNDVRCLSSMLDFIEKGNYLPLWKSNPVLPLSERMRMEKEFNICKAALIKCVVEVAGEKKNEEVLWDDSEEEKPGGDFVCRMVKWIKNYVQEVDDGSKGSEAREDLVICASLSLGNLACKETHTATLLSPPHSLASILTSKHLLSAGVDIKVKHGIIGLLRHIAQSSVQSMEIHTTLANAKVVQYISESGIWDETGDAMAEVVQLGAIGVVKFLCNTVVENTFSLVLPSQSENDPRPSGLQQLLALVKRSDSVPVKSEGTRVLVNVVKSLWSNVSISGSPVATGSSPIANGTVDAELEKQKKKSACVRLVLIPETAAALASLVRRGGRFPLLVNEGVVALSLLSTHRTGASLVLKALLDYEMPPMPPTEPPSTSSSISTDISSPTMSTPSTAHHPLGFQPPQTCLDMLVNVMRNVDNPANFPPEVRINVCSLFIQLGRNGSGDELSRVKDTMRPVFEKVRSGLEGAQGKEETLVKSITKVLDVWGPG